MITRIALPVALAIGLYAPFVAAQVYTGEDAEDLLTDGEVVASRPTASGFELLVRSDSMLFVCDVTVGIVGFAPAPLAQTLEATCAPQDIAQSLTQ